MEIFFGIDFGTTNSSAAYIADGAGMSLVRCGDENGGPFPSVIAIDKDTGEIYRGKAAWEKRRELAQRCEVISSIKSWLGTDREWLIAGKTWTPEMITAEIFNGLKEQIYSRHRFNITEATVAVPVAFTLEKRKALKEAARLAGIKVKGFVSESTSAFFRNYKHIKHCVNVVVFDWGGGTLDISVLKNEGGKVYELAASGMEFGGNDIDLLFAQWLHGKIIKDKPVKKSFEEMEPKYQDMLLVRAEEAKKELSDMDSATVALNRYGEYGAVRIKVDIDTFSALMANKIDAVIKCLEQTIRDAGMSMEEMDAIIMAGGSSNLRSLLDKIETMKWYDKVVFPDDPVWNVAEGTAMLNKGSGTVRLNQDIGIVLSDGMFYPLFKKGMAIDDCKLGPIYFGTVDDAKTAVFAFGDGHKIIDHAHVPVYAFYDELIEFQAQIDEYMVFTANMRSTKRPGDDPGRFAHSELRFYYELPRV